MEQMDEGQDLYFSIACGAAENGRFDIVQQIITDNDFDIAYKSNKILRKAVKGGHRRIVLKLLKNPRVIEVGEFEDSLYYANEMKYYDIVLALLTAKKIHDKKYKN